MITSLITIGVAALAFLAIISLILCALAAAMLSSQITQHQEDRPMTTEPTTNDPIQQYARRVEIFNAIRRERHYQDRKYGTIAQRNLTLDDYIVIMSDELCEAGISFRADDLDNARCELLQVAAVAIAALEAHGLVERDQLNTTGV